MDAFVSIVFLACVVSAVIAVALWSAGWFRKCEQCGSRRTISTVSESADMSYPWIIHKVHTVRCLKCGHEAYSHCTVERSHGPDMPGY